MQIALISISHCPSLATRSLRRYCLAHEDVRGRVEFTLVDRHLRDFLRARVNSTLSWSFANCADQLLASLVELRPAIVAFSCYLWNTELSIHLAGQIKRLLPRTQIVLGGPDVGPRAQALLERHREIDVIVDGDGEIPFLEIVRRHLAHEPLELGSVPQVSYRVGETVVRSAAPTLDPDLSLLRDVFEDLPTPEEQEQWTHPFVLYETMRGCPYQCSYCMYGKIPPNRKETAIVVEELAAIMGRGLRVNIIDPTFTTYTKRAKEILRGLANRTYSGSYWCEAFPDSIDEEFVDLFRKTNLHSIGVGFQTVSAAGLKAVSRPQNVARFERAVRLLREAELRFVVDVIYGLPGTTAADFLATMDYLHEQGVTNIVVYRLLGLPGSPMMRDVDTYGLVFSPNAPYELLSSRSFSIDDILFCEAFTDAFFELSRRMGSALLRQFARMAGSFSALIRLVMESGALQYDDDRELTRILVGLMTNQAGNVSSDVTGLSVEGPMVEQTETGGISPHAEAI